MKKSITMAACLLTVAGVYWIAQAGDMEPPGAPAPTMKTLDEVEPRIPVHASDLPLTISSPGSYCLTENIATSGGGITISTDNVTIDLMGHTLSGGTGDGIIAAYQSNVTVRNGIVSGWSSDGINLTTVHNAPVIGVRALANGWDGIRVGGDSRVIDCVANSNAAAGIIAQDHNSTISRCTAKLNGSIGIQSAGEATVVEGCIAKDNESSGIYASYGAAVIGCAATNNLGYGIRADTGSAVSNCGAYRNRGPGISASSSTVTASAAASNADDGFIVSGSTITGCTATANAGDGIEVWSRSVVSANYSLRNGEIYNGAGIFIRDNIASRGSRIEGNNVVENFRGGIVVEYPGNLIIKNSASGNSIDYDIVPGNDVGPIGSAATSTSPWANIEF